jgi:hypothetical protein
VLAGPEEDLGGEAVTIKIKAPRAWSRKGYIGAFFKKQDSTESAVRIVRESDYRRLLKLVRAVEFYEETGGGEDAIDALDALKGAK